MDSHIDTRQYKPGVASNGDKLSIQLNTAVDSWAGEAMERGDAMLHGAEIPHFFYKESQKWYRLMVLDSYTVVYPSS